MNSATFEILCNNIKNALQKNAEYKNARVAIMPNGENYTIAISATINHSKKQIIINTDKYEPHGISAQKFLAGATKYLPKCAKYSVKIKTDDDDNGKMLTGKVKLNDDSVDGLSIILS